MPNVEETKLPGIGVRHEFTTRSGKRLGVITHRTGQRDLLLYSQDDPDACGQVVRLEDDDSRALVEMLGTSQVSQNLTDLRQDVGGMVIDWMPINPSYSCSSCRVQDTGVREKTGVMIVAVLRDGKMLPVPTEDFQLKPGDMAVVVGTRENIGNALAMLQSRSADATRSAEPGGR